MIELKKEVNELRRALGNPVRYPLEFEKDGNGDAARPRAVNTTLEGITEP